MSWRRPLKTFSVLSATASAFLAVAVTSLVAGETTPALEDVSNPAKNLARMNCGTTIDLIGPNGRPVVAPPTMDKDSSVTALILDDDTLSYPLTEGETTFILTFPRTSSLDRFTFVNENASAEGEMKIFVSNYRLAAHSSKWIEVAGSTPFTGKRLVNLSLLGVEARYVKLSFQVGKAGRIAALGLYGGQSLQKFAARQRGIVRVVNHAAKRRLEDMLNFNFANLYARARVVFVSSGSEELSRRMIDDDAVTSFRFAPIDPNPTVVVELAKSERLHRVSALYDVQAGRLDVFLLQELRANPGDLSGLTPVASVTDPVGGGKAAMDFDPKGARYVALRWTSAELSAGKGFEVAEVSAFGDMPLSMLSTSELPDVYADNSMGLMSPPLVTQPPVLPLISP
jgi:hypothetical protein